MFASARINGKEAINILNNLVDYSQGFLQETKAKESYIASKLANTSISGFYEYLDVLARTNPAMLHHVYEWGQVGNPEARLVELQKILKGNNVDITPFYLESQSIPEGGSEPFYNKVEIMEEGIPVTVQAINTQAMFFEDGGEEFFRVGPIVIANPGGEAVRGAFVQAFEEFYNVYLDQVYLRSIQFYDHFRDPNQYESGLSSALKSGNARSAGRQSALSWILSVPGDEYE